MKISHESPIALLKISRAYNDYDYALVHLFEQYPEYYKFFEESLGMGREVILDNSIFELGKAFDMEEFHKWVLKLRPTYFIIPDVFDSCSETIKNVIDWRKRYGTISDGDGICMEMAVVQGATPEDFLDCYKRLYDLDIPLIAFPVNSSSYLNGCPYYPQAMMEGRYEMISRCLAWARLQAKLLDPDYTIPQAHHLLGLSLPQEAALYKDTPEIVSIDTSNPVLHGMLGVWYDDSGCLQEKSSNKMHEMMEWAITEGMFDVICENITRFRGHLN